MSEEMINNIQEEIAIYKKLKKEKEDIEEKLRFKAFPDYFLNICKSSPSSLEKIKIIMKNLVKAPILTRQIIDSDRHSLNIITLTYYWRKDTIVASYYEDPDDECLCSFIIKKNDEIIMVDDEEDEDDEDTLKYYLTDWLLYKRKKIFKDEDYLDSYLKSKLLK